MKKVFHFLPLLFIVFSTYSQTENTTSEGHYTIGISPLTSSNINEAYVSLFQASVSKTFASKDRFTVVDRTKLNEISKEKNLQKQEDFMNSNFTVEQGKSIGAQYIVSGNLSLLTAQTGQKTKLNIFTNQYYTVNIVTVNATISLQIIDVATGMIKSSKTFTKALETETTDQNLAITNTVSSIEGNYLAWINDVFPVYMKVIRVESVNKKGFPDKLFIKGGGDMNLNHEKNLLFNNSSELNVFFNESFNVDGKEYKRAISIGKVKIEEVQGEFSICKVKSGAEEIKKRLDEGKTLLLQISKY